MMAEPLPDKHTLNMHRSPHRDNGLTQFYKDDKIVRQEFCSPHKDNGLIQFYEDDKLVRAEFRSPHGDDGLTQVCKDGKLVRAEFRSPHEDDGLTTFCEDGKILRKEFRSPHEYDGATVFYENDKIVRKEFRSPHEDDGVTQFYKDGKVVRAEFRSPREDDGVTQFYKDGKIVRAGFRSPHKDDGITEFYEKGKIVRTEYRSPHKQDGTTVFYKKDKVLRKEFRSPHKDDGVTAFCEDGKPVRKEYRSPHRDDGFTWFLKDDKTLRMVWQSPHIHNGLVQLYEDDNLVHWQQNKEDGRHKGAADTPNLSAVREPLGADKFAPHPPQASVAKEPTTIDASEIAAPRKQLDAATLQKRMDRRQKPSKVNAPPREAVQLNFTVRTKHSRTPDFVTPVVHNAENKAAAVSIIRDEERLNSRKCPTCMRWNTRIDNNNHVKCVCKTEFCFLCMKVLDGHCVSGTTMRHFGNGKCQQHGDQVFRPSPALLNKLGHVTFRTESVAAFSINTLDATLPPSNGHASARAHKRGVSDTMKKRTILRGSEKATCSKDGTPSIVYKYEGHKVWTSEDGTIIKSVA